MTVSYYNTYAKLMVVHTEDGKMYFLKKDGSKRYGPVPLTNYIPKRTVPETITAAVNTKYNIPSRGNRDVTVFFAETR